MAYIGTDINYGNIASQTGVGNGSTTPIATLDYTVPTASSIIVTLDGVTQVPTTDYTATGTTLTFTSTVASPIAILVVFLGRSLDIGTPADNTVTNAKMANNSVDSAELVAGSVDDAHLATGITASKLSGVVPSANLGTGTASSSTVLYGDGTYKAEPVTDLTAVRQDLAMLALYNAVSDNRAAYNLPSSFIDQFEDDTGLTTQTNVDRDATGEYVSSSIETISGHTVTKNGNIARSSTQAKFGTYSAYFDGSTGTYLSIADSTDWDFGTNDFTIEWWGFGISGNDAVMWNIGNYESYTSNLGYITGTNGTMYLSSTGGSWNLASNDSFATGINAASWQHYAFVSDGTTYRYYQDGVQISTVGTSAALHHTGGMTIGYRGGGLMTGYIDEARISNVARYPSGTTFTPHTSVHVADANTKLLMHMEDANLIDEGTVTTTVNATGTLISDTQTASSATTKMSGVILYKDNAGTATLGTDLVISLSANGGTNYTEAASYGAVTPLFSTGVKMVRLGETTVTSGTTPVIKAVWANQASGSKETQLHGWAMNY